MFTRSPAHTNYICLYTGADVYIDENICKPIGIGKHVTYHHDLHHAKPVDLHEDVPLKGNRLPDNILYVLKY